jgi:chromosome segregation ATPase
MEYTKKYFINEWTGKEWLRKELLDGESVVVIGKDKTYAEYRNVDGELVDVASLIYDEVITTITPKIDIIETNIENLEEKIDNEIERSTTKDNELESTISTVNENLVTAVNTINQNMADGFNNINENVAQGFNTINAAIEAERQIRAEKDTELENAINTEKEERISDIQALQEEDARINEKIDVLEEKVDNIEQDLNDKIEQEKTEREAKDAEIEAQLLTQEGTEFNKNTGLLTLKSKGGTNDVQVQFNFNFGTF